MTGSDDRRRRLAARSAIHLLAAITPVEAVAGNNDPPALAARLGTRRLLELEGVRIGMIHGHLGPDLRDGVASAETRSHASRAWTSGCG